MRVVVIGAGIAGLAAADKLCAAGAEVLVLEKSRGVGGRIATRESRSGYSFDHGCQAVTARSAEFQAYLKRARAAGVAEAGAMGGAIGAPTMTALLRPLAEKPEIRFDATVSLVHRGETGWMIDVRGGRTERADAVICTAPAPQTAEICKQFKEIAGPAATVTMLPCWAIMAAWIPEEEMRPSRPAAPLEGAWETSARPGRDRKARCWVGHAGPVWSTRNLESDASEIAGELMYALASAAGGRVSDLAFKAAHRWRYARVTRPVGVPMLRVEGGLYAAGDWLLGSQAEDAYLSGLAAAKSALETSPAPPIQPKLSVRDKLRSGGSTRRD